MDIVPTIPALPESLWSRASSKATEYITDKMLLDWLRKAHRNSLKIRYRDQYGEAATQELRRVLGLLLRLLFDPRIKGPSDLGKQYVEIRSNQLREEARR